MKLGLDVGCGTAKAKLSEKMYPDLKWIGTDSTDFGRLYKPDEFVHHDLKDPLPFDTHSFDMIWCHHVLEHLPFFRPGHYGTDFVVWVINEFWRVLKPGCQAHIIVPDVSHTNAYRSPTHYRFMNDEVWHWFDYTNTPGDHEAMSLWSKWDCAQSKLQDNCHSYGILVALEWNSEDEMQKWVGDLRPPDWRDPGK